MIRPTERWSSPVLGASWWGVGDEAFENLVATVATAADLAALRARQLFPDAVIQLLYTSGTAVEELQRLIREVPKLVIARVNGFAIGGGHVLATICDLTIASDKAQFGRVGPRVGPVDPGFGTACLARIVGEKKARAIWYLCRRYTAAEALAMGLANAVVPHAELDAKVDRWCAELLMKSPTALARAKRSFNADTASICGISSLGMQALSLFHDTDESKEGAIAFREKRKPDFQRHFNKKAAG